MIPYTTPESMYATSNAFSPPKDGRIDGAVNLVGGTLALEGGPIFWVATHRIHHQHSDREGDPHTPHDGGFWAHVGWILTAGGIDAVFRIETDADTGAVHKVGSSTQLFIDLVPAGIGAKAACPERPVVVFTGDAGFWYHLGEIDEGSGPARPAPSPMSRTTVVSTRAPRAARARGSPRRRRPRPARTARGRAGRQASVLRQHGRPAAPRSVTTSPSAATRRGRR